MKSSFQPPYLTRKLPQKQMWWVLPSTKLLEAQELLVGF